MDVSPQYVNKIVKGKENLSLETIAKIEEALGISLISVERNFQYIQPATTSVEIPYSQIPLSESRSTKVSDGFSTFSTFTKSNDDVA